MRTRNAKTPKREGPPTTQQKQREGVDYGNTPRTQEIEPERLEEGLQKGLCTAPAAPLEKGKENAGRDALGRFVPGEWKGGPGRSFGSGRATIDEMLDDYGPTHIANLQAEAAETATAQGMQRARREAKRDLTKLVGRRVADRVTEERSLTPAAERRLIQIMEGLSLAEVREVVSIQAVEVAGELGAGETYNDEGQDEGFDDDEGA